MSLGVPIEYPVDYKINRSNGTAKPIYADEGSRVSVQFKKVLRPNIQKMLKTGREEFTEEILLVKKKRGSSTSPSSRATEQDKRTYREEWELFKRRESGDHGSSITKLYGIRPTDIDYLVQVGIYTIEELVSADEEVTAQLDGGEVLLKLANIWLEARAREQENKNAVAMVASLNQKVQQLEKELAAATAKKPRAKRKPRAKVLKEESNNDSC